MLTRILIILGFLTLIYSLNDSYCQPRQQDRLAVNVKVNVISVDSLFVYEYSVSNIPKSEQNLENFIIETGDFVKINDNKSPTNGKWSFWNSYLKVNVNPTITTNTVEWIASYDSISSVNTTFSPPQSVVKPGESSTFSFRSDGLPSIKSLWARGWAKPYSETEYDSLIVARL